MRYFLVLAVAAMLWIDAYLWATGKPVSPMATVFTDAALLLYVILYEFAAKHHEPRAET